MLLWILVDETASLWSGLHVVAKKKVIELSQRFVEFYLHLTNITE